MTTAAEWYHKTYGDAEVVGGVTKAMLITAFEAGEGMISAFIASGEITGAFKAGQEEAEAAFRRYLAWDRRKM